MLKFYTKSEVASMLKIRTDKLNEILIKYNVRVLKLDGCNEKIQESEVLKLVEKYSEVKK